MNFPIELCRDNWETCSDNWIDHSDSVKTSDSWMVDGRG